MTPLPLRLPPGADLRPALEAVLAEHGVEAGFVVAGIGSLREARLRYAGRDESESLGGALEILTLSGSLATDGAHLHLSVSDADGRVFGGHVSPGCVVRTTAEVLVILLPQWSFTRELDPATGYRELRLRHPG